MCAPTRVTLMGGRTFRLRKLMSQMNGVVKFAYSSLPRFNPNMPPPEAAPPNPASCFDDLSDVSPSMNAPSGPGGPSNMLRGQWSRSMNGRFDGG